MTLTSVAYTVFILPRDHSRLMITTTIRTQLLNKKTNQVLWLLTIVDCMNYIQMEHVTGKWSNELCRLVNRGLVNVPKAQLPEMNSSLLATWWMSYSISSSLSDSAMDLSPCLRWPMKLAPRIAKVRKSVKTNSPDHSAEKSVRLYLI